MTILIIEDEEATARKLQRLLTEVEPTATVLGLLGSVEESVAWLQTQTHPDLILMDIELADGQSFEIFKHIAVQSPVIFTTAYDEYAIKAFRVNSIDYLLKPVKEADLRSALAKLRTMKQVLAEQPNNLLASLEDLLQQLRPIPSVEQSSDRDHPVRDPERRTDPVRQRFLVKQGQRLFSVPIDDVLYFFSRNKLTFLKTGDAHEWLIDYTMDELEHMLDPQRFFRLNRQIIAGMRAVERINLYFNGKLKVTLQPTFEQEVLVSREKAPDFKRWLGE